MVLVLQGVARREREASLDYVHQVLMQCGWIRHEQELPGGAVCFVFETAVENVTWLAESLDKAMVLDDESTTLVRQVRDSRLSGAEARVNIRGTLELGFAQERQVVSDARG